MSVASGYFLYRPLKIKSHERGVGRSTYSCQTTNLFAYPSDPIGDVFQTVNDGDKKAVRYLHQHGQPGRYDGLHIKIGSSEFWGYPPGKIFRKRTSLLFNLVDHLLIDLSEYKKNEKQVNNEL